MKKEKVGGGPAKNTPPWSDSKESGAVYNSPAEQLEMFDGYELTEAIADVQEMLTDLIRLGELNTSLFHVARLSAFEIGELVPHISAVVQSACRLNEILEAAVKDRCQQTRGRH